MTTQIAVKIPDDLLASLDALVAQGRFASRSAAVREGLDLLARQAKREAIDQAFRDGFTRTPEEAQVMADARRLATEAIEDEPWEPWW